MPVINLNETAAIMRGGTGIAALYRGATLLWEQPAAAERVTLETTDAVAFSAHSLLDTASGLTPGRYHGGSFPDIWTGDLYQTYWPGSYASYRWGMNGPDRTEEAYDALVITEMGDLDPESETPGVAPPDSPLGIDTLQYFYWHALTAQAKGARLFAIYPPWTARDMDASWDARTMSIFQYVREWLTAQEDLTIPVYIIPTPHYIREVIAINAVHNPGWNVFIDNIHLNGWQEVDEGLSVLVKQFLTGERGADDAGESAFFQAIVQMGWEMLQDYECSGFGGTTLTPAFEVASDPLPDPLPLGGGGAVAPTITVQPSFSPASADVNDMVTLFLGSASGSPSPTASWTLTRGAVDVSEAVSGSMDIVLDQLGTYTLAVTWTNASGSVNATSATITVTADIVGEIGSITINSMSTPPDLSISGGVGSITISEPGES